LLSAQKRERGFDDLGVNKFGIDANDFPVGVLVAKTVFLEPLVQFLDGVACAFVCIASMEVSGVSCDCINAAKCEFYSIQDFFGVGFFKEEICKFFNVIPAIGSVLEAKNAVFAAKRLNDKFVSGGNLAIEVIVLVQIAERVLPDVHDLVPKWVRESVIDIDRRELRREVAFAALNIREMWPWLLMHHV
jgi:hypothetical protein